MAFNLYPVTRHSWFPFLFRHSHLLNSTQLNLRQSQSSWPISPIDIGIVLLDRVVELALAKVSKGTSKWGNNPVRLIS